MRPDCSGNPLGLGSDPPVQHQPSHCPLEPRSAGDIGRTKALNRCARQLTAAGMDCCNAAQHLDLLGFKMQGALQWSLVCADTHLESI